MAAKTVRRRLHHTDVDGTKDGYVDTSDVDALSEPLLRKYNDENNFEENNRRSGQDIWDEKKKNVPWASFFSHLVAQWAQWLANIIISSRSLLRRLLPLPSSGQNGQDDKNCSACLSPLQEERLRKLRQRLEVPFDNSRMDHQDALKQLWKLAYPNREPPPLKSELWKEMGWQGTDPSTDFRGGGFISLENLIYFAKRYPDAFQRLLHKQDGKRADWEYPFAVAGINVSFMLAQMLDLHSGSPTSRVGAYFLELLGGDEMAFDNLYCVAFQLLDMQWLARQASYMEFNEVLKSTRIQLERELASGTISSIQDLPAYHMLNR